MKIKYFFLTGFLAILLIFSIPVVQKLLGYYPGLPGWEMAQIAVKKQNVKLCERITALPWAIFVLGPPTAERRISCVHRYATLAKDPSACELLMPSSYGLSCVGGAIDSPECGFNQGYEVQWNEGNPVLKSSLKDCQKNIQRSETGEACCFIAKIGFVKDENDCSPLKNQERFYNECLDRLSFKNHDPTICEGITDKNLKVACIVRAKAMKQDPSICTGCTPLLETLEDIK
jgi:hypothetical protein